MGQMNDHEIIVALCQKWNCYPEELVAKIEADYVQGVKLAEELEQVRAASASLSTQLSKLQYKLGERLEELWCSNRAVNDLNNELDKARAHLGNLLATIHGDGGQYQVENGTDKAVEDALAKWHEKGTRIAELEQAARYVIHAAYPQSQHQNPCELGKTITGLAKLIPPEAQS
jgi:chromosome segregation ATPase